jgi:hypothetical protein
MPDRRCPSCGTRKARRACPALDREICAVCCGSKRLVEIACPADCGWLRSAALHPPAVTQKRQERDLAFIYGALGTLSERQARVLLCLQVFTKQHAPSALPPLLDRDVAEAAAALASTFETAAKGILYEHRAASLPAQRLAAELKRGLDELARAEAPAPDRDTAAALRMMEKLARDAASNLGDGDRSYLELIDRVMKPTRGEEAPAPADAPRVILP